LEPAQNGLLLLLLLLLLLGLVVLLALRVLEAVWSALTALTVVMLWLLVPSLALPHAHSARSLTDRRRTLQIWVRW
jgi:hypothetical protein